MKKILSTLVLLLALLVGRAADNVTLSLSSGNRAATLRNGIVSVYIGATGKVESCILKGDTEAQDIQLINTAKSQAFYFSCNQPDYSELNAGETQVVVNTDDMAEVTFSQTSATGIKWTQGYILRKGDSGYYTYLVAEGVGDNSLGEARVVFRLDDSKFRYGYVNSRMQGIMPDAAEMTRSESRQVQDATFRLDDNSIYTKYNWANYLMDDHFHGLIDETDGVGAWTIPVSTEYINGGPMRQDLTVHASDQSPLILQMLHGTHFGAGSQVYATGTKKIYGPFFFYINKGSREEIIADAASKATELEAAWPFSWFSNTLYPTARTTVTGRLKVTNGYDASPVRVVLSKTAEPYDEGDSYIYTAETESDGSFTIDNVRPDSYVLTAYALSGGNTSQLTKTGITVSGTTTDLGTVAWVPECFGTEVFRIGESNRLSDGYKLSDAARAYELYESVPADLTFTVGESNATTDWYYAQTKVGTWTIKFNVTDPNHPFRLTASAAGAANVTRINVYVNGTEKANNTWTYQSDGSVYRSAVQSGCFQQHTLDIPAGVLKSGENTIALELSEHNYATSGIAGIMWDCIKLEMDEASESYDFTNRGTTGGTVPDWGSDVTAGGQSLQILAFGSETFGNRFACGPKRGDATVFKFRDSGDSHGLYSEYDSRYFSILNLKAGDKVTLTLNANEANITFADGTAVVSKQEYTVEEDGTMDFVSTGKVWIEKVDITPYVAPAAGSTETVTVGVPAVDNTYDLVQAPAGSIVLPDWGTTVTSGGVTLNMLALGGNTFDNRIAVGPTSRNNESGNCFKFRTADSPYKGLWSQYSDRNISVLNLMKGDKVTFIISKDDKTLKVVDGDVVASGTPITMTANGNLDLVTTGSVYIESIQIERDAVNTGGSTLVSTNALDFTGLDVFAYVATAVSGSTVTFSRVEKVPANTPLFLTAEEAVSVDVPILDGEADEISTNYLKGKADAATALNPTGSNTYYLYGVKDDVAGFYKLGGTGAYSSAAGKAYLEVPAVSAPSFLNISFGGGTTAIEDAVKSDELREKSYYNLAGQRVDQPTKGLYIVNGKKVIIP